MRRGISMLEVNGRTHTVLYITYGNSFWNWC